MGRNTGWAPVLYITVTSEPVIWMVSPSIRQLYCRMLGYTIGLVLSVGVSINKLSETETDGF